MKKAEIVKEMDRIIEMMNMDMNQRQEYMNKRFNKSESDSAFAYHFMEGVICVELECLKHKIETSRN